MLFAVLLLIYGKAWRIKCAPKYFEFIGEGAKVDS
jgi:hypothetical protein